MALILALVCLQAHATVNTSLVAVHAYASANVTTSAYTTLIASTAINVSSLEVCDTSTKLLKIATGAAGSETDRMTVFISGCVTMPLFIPKGTRISIEAVDANATSGFNTVSLPQ